MGIFQTNQMLRERINLYNPLVTLPTKCSLLSFTWTCSGADVCSLNVERLPSCQRKVLAWSCPCYAGGIRHYTEVGIMSCCQINKIPNANYLAKF